jgi:hypothetical protein
MRRRQIFAEREFQLREEAMKSVKVPNSNIISDSAQPALKEKYAMFAPEIEDIEKPNASPYRKRGSKPGKGAYESNKRKNAY